MIAVYAQNHNASVVPCTCSITTGPLFLSHGNASTDKEVFTRVQDCVAHTNSYKKVRKRRFSSSQLLKGVTISCGGVLPHILPQLLKRRTAHTFAVRNPTMEDDSSEPKSPKEPPSPKKPKKQSGKGAKKAGKSKKSKAVSEDEETEEDD